MIIHDRIPVFSDKHNEDSSEPLIQRVEVLPWINTSFECFWVYYFWKVLIVIHDFKAIHFTSNQRKDKHEQKHQNWNVCDIFDSNDYLLQQLSKWCPASSKLKDSKKSNSSERRNSTSSSKINTDPINDVFNERNHNYWTIKQIEAICSVVFESKSNQFYYHFCKENPWKDLVHALLEIAFRLFNWVLVHSQENGVEHNTSCNWNIEIVIGTNNEEELVDDVFLGSFWIHDLPLFLFLR